MAAITEKRLVKLGRARDPYSLKMHEVFETLGTSQRTRKDVETFIDTHTFYRKPYLNIVALTLAYEIQGIKKENEFKASLEAQTKKAEKFDKDVRDKAIQNVKKEDIFRYVRFIRQKEKKM